MIEQRQSQVRRSDALHESASRNHLCRRQHRRSQTDTGRKFDPKEMVQPDRIMGLEDMMAEVIKFKYMPQRLDQAQIKDLIQIP
jgi:hypothetical protein